MQDSDDNSAPKKDKGESGWLGRMFGLNKAENTPEHDSPATADIAPQNTAPVEAEPKQRPATNPAPVTRPETPSGEQSREDAPGPGDDTVNTSVTQPEAPTREAKPAATAAPEVPETPDANWLQRMTDGLKKSTSKLSDGISGIFTKKKLDDDTLDDLEDLLITADLGASVAAKIAEQLRQDRFDKTVTDVEVKNALAGAIEGILAPIAKPLSIDKGHRPHIIVMVGVNGAGKTTTIGKLARQFKDQGKSVMLAAGDTFRAAAIEQLQIWGERTGSPVITKAHGADAAALAYEAVESAIAQNVDILLIDTAGRLQNREELMAELAKVVRVIGKKIDGAPHDTLLVLDATTGQNAISQVEIFQKMANISGLVMTKLDGSARGGVLVACADKFGLPVHAIGVGEGIEDLRAFNPAAFAKALVGVDTNS